jgi:DNA processing protein
MHDSGLFPPLRHDRDERWALVALSLVPGVGPGRIRKLVSRFGTATAVLGASSRALAEVPGIGPQTAGAILSFDAYRRVADQFERAERAGATLTVLSDDAYPRLLREIYDPPTFLWTRGVLTTADTPAIAVVGTRRATEYGRHVAQTFAAELALLGVSVISGLAFGIDAAAHRGALSGGGVTVAVLGSGVDRIYPGRHTGLARSIEARGAVVSEYPMGAEPDAPNFPRRNRIISGAAHGTLVVEAYEKGGALITARMALEQNREVFAVPSPINSKAGEGSNYLIQQGYAKLVRSVDEVLEELAHTGMLPPAPARPAPPPLRPEEQRLHDVLEASPQHIDRLCQKTGLDPSSALVHLLSLEFKGMVRQMAGKQFCRA